MDLRDRLSYLFGSEENVDLRRQLVLLREKLMNDIYIENLRYICSGSVGEGVAYPPSDDDVMYYATSSCVVNSFGDVEHIRDLLMVPSEDSAGYCMLFDVNRSYPRNLYVSTEMPFVSSLLWKQAKVKEGESIHGPCQSSIISGVEYDHAYCISCSFWPDIANDWVIKNRPHGWPSHELIQSIVQHGCHVVPIGGSDQSLSQHEWRISFSVAERTLMHSMSHTQFLTYNVLRLCLKRAIVPDVMCSYFMKTALFFSCERTSTQDFHAGDIETCFKSSLCVLYDFVDQRYCPNYFVPDNNMIKRKINHSNRGELLGTIRTLHGFGVACTMHRCGERRCLNDNPSLVMKESKLDYAVMHSMHVQLTLITLMQWMFKQKHHTAVILHKLVDSIQGSSTVLQNFIFLRGIIYCCYHMTNYVLSSNGVNKSNYPLHKTIKALLRIGYRVDVTTGTLAAATYGYLIGKTESALSHSRRMLSEYPSYVIDGMPNDIKRTSYMQIMCGRGYTIDNKLRRAYAPLYDLDVEALHAFPLPLHIGIYRLVYLCLEPLSYAYFLESLCYIRLQNHRALMKSTRCLVTHMANVMVYSGIFERLCIGIIKFEHGDEQSASRWLGSAFMMKDVCLPPDNERISQSVLTYIACLLNRRFRELFRNLGQ